MSDTLLSRFLRYVRINTQSDASTGTSPSTPGQWVLLRMLESELLEMGAANVVLTEYGYVMGTIPATSARPGLPTVAFLGHVDTAPDFSGQNVKPLVNRKWNGKRIVLPDDATQMLDPALSVLLLGQGLLRSLELLASISGNSLVARINRAAWSFGRYSLLLFRRPVGMQSDSCTRRVRPPNVDDLIVGLKSLSLDADVVRDEERHVEIELALRVGRLFSLICNIFRAAQPNHDLGCRTTILQKHLTANCAAPRERRDPQHQQSRELTSYPTHADIVSALRICRLPFMSNTLEIKNGEGRMPSPSREF